MKIRQVRTKKEINQVRKLFREYEAFLGEDLCFQSFEEELAALPGVYSPPDGDLLIGIIGKRVMGCVAVRRLDDGVCEMKRLFVRQEARGKGLGRELAVSVMEVARKLGYSMMKLDTLERLTEAINLYESLGFYRIEPYYENPLSGVLYWEINLNRFHRG